MNKLYVSKIDNKTFTDKEDLIQHLIDNYTMVDQSEGESIKLLKQLQNAFPFAQINMTDSSEPNYGQYIVTMVWEKYNGDFNFYIGKHYNHDYYYQSFEKVEDAITYYNTFIEKANIIISSLKETYKTSEVKITQMYEGDMNSENSISFELILDGESYFERYEFGDVKEFVNSFRGFFDNIIEGEVVIERDFANGHDKEPKIGGVPVNNILERAKKVRIEILESK